MRTPLGTTFPLYAAIALALSAVVTACATDAAVESQPEWEPVALPLERGGWGAAYDDRAGVIWIVSRERIVVLEPMVWAQPITLTRFDTRSRAVERLELPLIAEDEGSRPGLAADASRGTVLLGAGRTLVEFGQDLAEVGQWKLPDAARPADPEEPGFGQISALVVDDNGVVWVEVSADERVWALDRRTGDWYGVSMAPVAGSGLGRLSVDRAGILTVQGVLNAGTLAVAPAAAFVDTRSGTLIRHVEGAAAIVREATEATALGTDGRWRGASEDGARLNLPAELTALSPVAGDPGGGAWLYVARRDRVTVSLFRADGVEELAYDVPSLVVEGDHRSGAHVGHTPVLGMRVGPSALEIFVTGDGDLWLVTDSLGDGDIFGTGFAPLYFLDR